MLVQSTPASAATSSVFHALKRLLEHNVYFRIWAESLGMELAGSNPLTEGTVTCKWKND
jgi:hypothetical protein